MRRVALFTVVVMIIIIMMVIIIIPMIMIGATRSEHGWLRHGRCCEHSRPPGKRFHRCVGKRYWGGIHSVHCHLSVGLCPKTTTRALDLQHDDDHDGRHHWIMAAGQAEMSGLYSEVYVELTVLAATGTRTARAGLTFISRHSQRPFSLRRPSSS
jgi:hypothetical protein